MPFLAQAGAHTAAPRSKHDTSNTATRHRSSQCLQASKLFGVLPLSPNHNLLQQMGRKEKKLLGANHSKKAYTRAYFISASLCKMNQNNGLHRVLYFVQIKVKELKNSTECYLLQSLYIYIAMGSNLEYKKSQRG